MKKIIIVLLVLAIISGISFYGGVKYDKNKVAVDRRARFGANVSGNFGARNGGGIRDNSFTNGEVIAKDDKSITIKLRGGNGQNNNSPDNSAGSKIIFFSSTSKVSKNVSGSLDDVKIGIEVAVSGTTNSDGSVNAETIQIRPSQKNK